MIFVTHSIEEAVLLGHRVIVLKGRPSSIHETITIDLPNRARARHCVSLVSPNCASGCGAR